jgi:hypothetical protein
MVCADAFEDASVVGAGGLGPDVGDLEVDQQRGHQDAVLQVVADGDHGPVEVTPTPSCCSAAMSVQSAMTACVRREDRSCTVRLTLSMASTSVPCRSSSRAIAVPKRPSPITTTGMVVRTRGRGAPRPARGHSSCSVSAIAATLRRSVHNGRSGARHRWLLRKIPGSHARIASHFASPLDQRGANRGRGEPMRCLPAWPGLHRRGKDCAGLPMRNRRESCQPVARRVSGCRRSTRSRVARPSVIQNTCAK